LNAGGGRVGGDPCHEAAGGIILAMRLFDVEEARRFVPFLLDSFGRIRQWVEQARAVTAMLEGKTLTGEDPESLRGQVEDAVGRVREEIARLEEAGITVKDVEGLVDFPAMMGDRHVLLCWKYPEESVDFWHELEAGFAGRQPIINASAFARSWLS
jgi:hypothetical protein